VIQGIIVQSVISYHVRSVIDFFSWRFCICKC